MNKYIHTENNDKSIDTSKIDLDIYYSKKFTSYSLDYPLYNLSRFIYSVICKDFV